MTQQQQIETEAMSLEAVNESVTWPEEQGFDAPFATMTWQRWLHEQAQIVQAFSRFVRAVEQNRADHAMKIGLEVQEFAARMMLEAYVMCANLPLEELPQLKRKSKEQ